MKQFLGGIAFTLCIVALLAADGGTRIMWEHEMKRPEMQQAVSDYIVGHCQSYLHSSEISQLSAAMKDQNGRGIVTLYLNCSVTPDSK